MASLDVEVDVESTSYTLSDDSTSTMGTAMSTVSAIDDEAIADDEAAADDEATVIAESVGVRDEAIVSGGVVVEQVTADNLRERCSSSESCRRGCSASSLFWTYRLRKWEIRRVLRTHRVKPRVRSVRELRDPRPIAERGRDS